MIWFRYRTAIATALLFYAGGSTALGGRQDTALVIRINHVGYLPAQPKVAVACALTPVAVTRFTVTDMVGQPVLGPLASHQSGSPTTPMRAPPTSSSCGSSGPVRIPPLWDSVEERTYEGERRPLAGFCLAGGSPMRATALAVLDATNRFLEIGEPWLSAERVVRCLAALVERYGAPQYLGTESGPEVVGHRRRPGWRPTKS